jgi:hypothetical protein
MLFEKNEKIDAIGLGAELYLKTLRESRQALARQESMEKVAFDGSAFVEVSPNRVDCKFLDKSHLTPEGLGKINSPELSRNLNEKDIIDAAKN